MEETHAKKVAALNEAFQAREQDLKEASQKEIDSMMLEIEQVLFVFILGVCECQGAGYYHRDPDRAVRKVSFKLKIVKTPASRPLK